MLDTWERKCTDSVINTTLWWTEVCDKHRHSYAEKESPNNHVALAMCQDCARHLYYYYVSNPSQQEDKLTNRRKLQVKEVQ